MKNWNVEKGRAFVSPAAPPMDLLIQIVEASDLDKRRKTNVKTAIRRVGRALGRPLHDLPADPQWLNGQLRNFAWGSLGVSRKTWRNTLSEFGFALKLAGIGTRLQPAPLTSDWGDLWAKVRTSGDMSLKFWLSRFFRFCQAIGVAPEDVTYATVEAYREEVAAAALNKDPDKAAYYAATLWNKAAETIDGWPENRIDRPDLRDIYCLDWATFPASLERDIDAWLSQASSDDIFDEHAPARPMKPITSAKRRYEIQRFASALVHAGVDAAELISIADLVAIDRVRIGLRWLRDNRFGGEKTGGLHNIAIALAAAARRHVGVEDAHQETLNGFVKRCDSTEAGMTLKNQLRMEPFKDPAVVVAHLDLPQRLMAKVARMRNARRAAVLAETALAIALMTWCPVRIKNIRHIDFAQNFHRETRRKRTRVYYVVPKGVVKNAVDIKFELPPHLIEMLDRFVADYRPLLAPRGGRFLFSMRGRDEAIDYNSISTRITATIRDHLGLTFTTHNFRHLAGLIWLIQHPTDYEVVRRLLGHRSASTAMDFYVGLRTDAAHAAFSQLLADFREGRRA